MKRVHIIKRVLLTVIALALVATSLFVPGLEISAASSSTTISKSSSTGTDTPVKEVFTFNDGWKFNRVPREEMDAVYETYRSFDFDDSGWEEVSAPHTWWKTASGETNETDEDYGFYRKKVTLSENMKNGQVWIEFEAAAHFVEVRVNGLYIGQHFGGYTKFRFNLNRAIDQIGWGKELVITVRTDAHHGDTPPVGGGFNKFPGLTGNVNIIYTDNVSAALAYDGGVNGTKLATSGIFVTPTRDDDDDDDLWSVEDDWKVKVESKIANAGAATSVLVKTTLRAMQGFDNVVGAEFLSFDPAKMSENFTDTKEQTVTLSEALTDFEVVFDVKNPRLWNGREDPFLYYADFEIYEYDEATQEKGKLLDKITESFGFRDYEITKDGFFLNGKSYPLRGVGYHEDYEGVGSAMNKEQWDESFKLIYELGGTFSRLSHYPHEQYSYELCDRYGIVVWAEIGMISGVSYKPKGTTQILPEFKERSKNHLKELIRQNKNHPSIVVWGLENELDITADVLEETNEFINELHNIAKYEDPTRLTTQTAGRHHNWANWKVDVTAFNFYPMWYGTGTFEGEHKKHLDVMNANNHFRDTALGYVEFGAGGGVADYQHSEYPERPEKTTVKFHPQEWQNIVHEEAIKMINNHDELWVASLWCMFDFACDSFNEGDAAGINDKGLVTRDRKTKKDAYYLYQANWVDDDTLPVIHIASSGMTEREVPKNTVTVYSNLDSVELFRGGDSLGVRTNDGNGIFKWEGVEFGDIEETATYTAKSVGDNVIVADSGVTQVEWTRVASEKLEIEVNRNETHINEDGGVIIFAGNMEAAKINEIFTSKYGAEIKLVEADGETSVTSGNVMNGMKLVVTSVSGENKKEYRLLSSNIAAGKTITASSDNGHNPEKALDGYIDDEHKWNANESDNGKSWIMVDLGESYILNSAKLHLYKGHGNNREYYYNIYVGTNENDLEKVVDRTNNKDVGTITDSLDGVQGRYVKIEFTGNSDYTGVNNSAVAALYELEISGYILSSTEVEFDHEKKIVRLPYEWSLESEKIQPDKIYNDITVKGNAYISVKSDTYYVDQSTKLIVYDIAGRETVYTVLLGEAPPYAGDTYSSFAWLAMMALSGGIFALTLISRRKATK